MTNQALTIGQLIANAHPADVRLLFQKYGIAVQPTGKTILDAYLVHGKPFVAELFQIASQSMISNTTGPLNLETDKVNAYGAAATAKGTTAAAAEPTGWDKFISIFDKGGQVLATTAGAYEKISNIFSGGKSVDTGDASLSAEMYKLQLQANAESDSNQTKTYLLIGAGVLVAVLVVIMYLKRN